MPLTVAFEHTQKKFAVIEVRTHDLPDSRGKKRKKWLYRVRLGLDDGIPRPFVESCHYTRTFLRGYLEKTMPQL